VIELAKWYFILKPNQQFIQTALFLRDTGGRSYDCFVINWYAHFRSKAFTTIIEKDEIGEQVTDGRLLKRCWKAVTHLRAEKLIKRVFW
jgi:hypothetical protein